MEKFDFLTKELVDSFSYTTITKNRKMYTEVNIQGRQYIKLGVAQALTIVGNLYVDAYGRKILMCGMSKQHPNDSKVDKNIAYEIAAERAMFDPDIVFYNVPEHITKFNFGKMMEWYVDGVDVEFVKTKGEKINNMF